LNAGAVVVVAVVMVALEHQITVEVVVVQAVDM
jgi:hypothetical protein